MVASISFNEQILIESHCMARIPCEKGIIISREWQNLFSLSRQCERRQYSEKLSACQGCMLHLFAILKDSYPKMNILSLFTRPLVFPNLYAVIFCGEHLCVCVCVCVCVGVCVWKTQKCLAPSSTKK